MFKCLTDEHVTTHVFSLMLITMNVKMLIYLNRSTQKQSMCNQWVDKHNQRMLFSKHFNQEEVKMRFDIVLNINT